VNYRPSDHGRGDDKGGPTLRKESFTTRQLRKAVMLVFRACGEIPALPRYRTLPLATRSQTPPLEQPIVEHRVPDIG